jgi:hypothetical protein
MRGTHSLQLPATPLKQKTLEWATPAKRGMRSLQLPATPLKQKMLEWATLSAMRGRHSLQLSAHPGRSLNGYSIAF